MSRTGVFELDGHRHAGEWLAAETGDSVGSALSLLEAAVEALAELPELEEAFRSGELSAAQVKEVAGAAIVDPGSTTELIDAARTEDFEGCVVAVPRLKAAKASKRTRPALAVACTRPKAEDLDRCRRHLPPRRQAHPRGRGKRCLAGLKDEADKIFVEAQARRVRESSGAYLADALVCLVTGARRTTAPPGPKALVHLRVDIAALRRGNTGPGELCEIAGVGPVSVATASELLGDCIASLVVTSATDVHAICNLGRRFPPSCYQGLVGTGPVLCRARLLGHVQPRDRPPRRPLLQKVARPSSTISPGSVTTTTS